MLKQIGILIVAVTLPAIAMVFWARLHALPSEAVRYAKAESSEGRTAIPGLFVPNQVIDLGTIAPTGMVDASFKFVNRSGKPLEITDVSPQCGCTVVTTGKQAIAPGGTALISVKLDAVRAGGPSFRKAILATVNGPVGVDYVHLYLTGTVDSSKQFAVFSNIVDVGDVVPGAEIHRSILFRGGSNILDAMPHRIAVELGQDTEVHIDVPTGPAEVATRSTEVIVTVPVDALVGSAPAISQLIISSSGIENHRTAISITGHISPPIIAEPSEAVLQLDNGDRESQRIELHGVGRKPFSIKIISSGLPIKLESSKGTATDGSVTISLRPDAHLTSSLRGFLVVGFDNGIPSLSIPVLLNTPLTWNPISATNSNVLPPAQ